MHWALAMTEQAGAFAVQPLTEGGEPAGPESHADAARIVGLDRQGARWVWDRTRPVVQALLPYRFGRCHEISCVERILGSRERMFGKPVQARAVCARETGVPVPDDVDDAAEPGLFGATAPPATTAELSTAFAAQLRRAGTDNALRLLLAAESASTLVAAEMGLTGLPLRAEVHAHTLAGKLGPRPSSGTRPARLAELAGRISAGFGFTVNPDSPVDLREAFRRLGFDLSTTRAWVLQQVDHPVVPLVLEYKELARLWTANGWAWLDEWVQGDRFRTEYLPGGVVSGRWAARGGGGLQIPKVVRSAVLAEDGHRLVVADAAQLEPRVLAAISQDSVLQALSMDEDLYSALAADGFGGDRASAKVALLGTIYGQTSGEAARLLPVLRRRYPAAMDFVERAARQGERGEQVRSVLGRMSPPPDPAWWAAVQSGSLPDATAGRERRGREVSRAWGRFTRNFVVQGSAADWAAVWLSVLRRDLRSAVPAAELVFFQHDELIVHAATGDAERVAALIVAAAAEATRLTFPTAAVAIPVRPTIVTRYSDAK